MQVHRTASQEASPNGHQKPESAAPMVAISYEAAKNAASMQEELRAAYEQIRKLEAALDECLDYFDDRADADCDQDGYVPNEEMKMLGRINETLHGPGAF